ncbi:MAG: arsenate reductase ArsC [Litorimonas sp.]
MTLSRSAPLNVLFLCTGNSARSILSEALMNDLGQQTANGRVWMGWSAGSRPSGVPHPDGLKELQNRGHRTDLYRSKSWDEFSPKTEGAGDMPSDEGPSMDIVITVCSNAANEVCPIFPGQHIKAHWPADDPAYIEPLAARQQAFSDVYEICKTRIEALIALEDLTPEAVQAIANIHA